MGRLWLAALALARAWRGALAQSPGFLVISAPRTSKISWVRLPEDGPSPDAMRPRTLIDAGLQHPQGIAVDQKRKRLFVADPDVQKIYSYQLVVDGDTLSTDGAQTVISSNVESRWVAVDGNGNLFFSDEPENKILKVSAEKLAQGAPSTEVVYSGNSLTQVNQPGGVAVDNLHVYWTNKHFGTQAGSVIRGAEYPEGGIRGSGSGAASISVLARNAVKSYGICIALGNVYYTDSERFLYGVKKSGGEAAEVSSSLNHPRGCTWDGDGTVYVADRAGAVYSFAGNMGTISRAEVQKAFDHEDAFGLAAVMSFGRRSSGAPHGLLAAAAAVAASAMLVASW